MTDCTCANTSEVGYLRYRKQFSTIPFFASLSASPFVALELQEQQSCVLSRTGV